MKLEKITSIIVVYLWCCILSSHAAVSAGKWYGEQNSNPRIALAASADGFYSIAATFPGAVLIYQEFNRKNFRPSRNDFLHTTLSLEIAICDGDGQPVKGTIFIKDKDGLWFQNRKEFCITDDKWHNLEVDLTANGGLIPIGHGAMWNSQYLASILDVGVSLYSSSKQNATIKCRNIKFTGQRNLSPLNIVNWQMAETVEQFQMLKSDFNLSREYFNPYDPEEVEVNVEVCRADGSKEEFPAFFTQDFLRRRHFTHEINTPAGGHYWAFRFTPQECGTYKIRLSVSDGYGKQKIFSEWRVLTVLPSAHRGFIRVCKTDQRYFEFSNGDFFFPIGINIHTNIDLRSEKQFKFGHLPDRGTYDYDAYWKSLSENGVNAAEIWMASWSFALEWSSSHPYYYGIGRYNLANAWRLDYVLDEAAAKGIYIHLTLDNHGKLSSVSDQEWDDNPFNINNAFSVANAGFIVDAEDFFSSARAVKYNRQRNRYIAGRWGAYTNIFGIEFWSEVNLVSNFDKIYASGDIETWHRNAASEFRQFDQGKHLLTTHFCGDYLNLLKYSRLVALNEFDYVAGDAYRNNKIHFVDQMRWHCNSLQCFGKPMLSTEFGGTAMAGNPEQVVGDIHSGIWSSFFKSQAGTPFLWWHDFIHLNNHYRHYRGFALFIKGIDWRGNNTFKELTVINDGSRLGYIGGMVPQAQLLFPVPPHWNLHDYWLAAANSLRLQYNEILPGKLFGRESDYFIECLSGGGSSRIYGWVFCRLPIFSYSDNNTSLPWWRKIKINVDYPLMAGIYRLRCYDTISNRELSDEYLWLDSNCKIISIPPFQIDVAFKLERQFMVDNNRVKQAILGDNNAHR